MTYAYIQVHTGKIRVTYDNIREIYEQKKEVKKVRLESGTPSIQGIGTLIQ